MSRKKDDITNQYQHQMKGNSIVHEKMSRESTVSTPILKVYFLRGEALYMVNDGYQN
jgi:hypothetical protein